MDSSEQIYRDLQRHLDKQAVGFPATKSGAEIRILKRLFSPGEARLAMYLTYKPDSIEDIYESARPTGLSLESIQGMLTNMVKNAVIGHVEKEGRDFFFSLPFVVGMFEGQVMNLSTEFLDDVDQFTHDKAFGLAFLSTKVPQMRTIPVGKSISSEHYVATYDHIVDVIKSADGPFAILECICRKSAALKGNPCRKTTRHETCMPIGNMAKHAIEGGAARAIDRAEALDIARMSEDDGLVFQPSNDQKVDFICACCGCCCGMIRVQKYLPKPVDFWATNYYASVKTENCSGCGTCVERCQVGALTIDDRQGVSSVNRDRCIGCGNCIVTCPAGAMSLERKKVETVPPADYEDLYETIMVNKKGPLGKIRLVAKLMFKI